MHFELSIPLQCAEVFDVYERSGEMFDQRLAVCQDTGIIAIADGSLIKFYRVENLHHSSEIANHNDCVRATSELLCIYQVDVRDMIDEMKSTVVVSCVLFASVGMLLVGITHSSSPSLRPISARLLGLRIYCRSLLPSSIIASTAYKPSRLAVDLAFSDLYTIDGSSKSAIKSMKVIGEKSSSSLMGSVILFFRNSSAYALFQWKERYSDRQLVIFLPPPNSAEIDVSITAIAAIDEGEWIAVADSRGREKVIARSLSCRSKKRVDVLSMYRMGIPVSDPTSKSQAHRILYQTKPCDTHKYCTALEWWKRPADKTLFLITAYSNGSISISSVSQDNQPAVQTIMTYPSLDSNPSAIRHIEHSKSNPFMLQFLCEDSWRQFTLKSSADLSTHLSLWPSINESYDFPVTNLRSNAEGGHGNCPLIGIQMVDAHSSAASTIADRFDSVKEPNMFVFILRANGLYICSPEQPGPLSLPPPSTDSIATTEFNTINHQSPDSIAISHNEVEDNVRRLKNDMTIQERYQLPPMPSDQQISLVNLSVNETTNKLTIQAYQQRLTTVAHRVMKMQKQLKTLRYAFQLFTNDVQQQMRFVNEQLDALTEQDR